ncbi:tau 95 subunit of transcription factor TFIIIC [Savitreella phatthalungensis]
MTDMAYDGRDEERPAGIDKHSPRFTGRLAQENDPPDELFFSIEFPGNVVNIDKAIAMLGGQDGIQRAVYQPEDARLELRFRPDDRFEHPVQASVLKTSNLLVKLKRDRGKVVDHEAVAIIRNTARFRAIADYQWNTSQSHFLRRLDAGIQGHDVDDILQFTLGEDGDELVPGMGLDLLPPPNFSQISISQHYLYQPAAGSRKVRGSEGDVLMINRTRGQRLNLIKVGFDDKTPMEAHPNLKDIHLGKELEEQIEVFKRLFEDRPMWTRRGLSHESKKLNPNCSDKAFKLSLSHVAYVFKSGPWRDAYARFGYDPRTDGRKGALHQSIYFTTIKDKAAKTGSQKTSTSHIFDGMTLYPESRAFSFLDVEDPQLLPIIWSAPLRQTPNPIDGFYAASWMKVVRAVMKGKMTRLVKGELPNSANWADRLRGINQLAEQELADERAGIPPSRTPKLPRADAGNPLDQDEDDEMGAERNEHSRPSADWNADGRENDDYDDDDDNDDDNHHYNNDDTHHFDDDSHIDPELTAGDPLGDALAAWAETAPNDGST